VHLSALPEFRDDGNWPLHANKEFVGSGTFANQKKTRRVSLTGLEWLLASAPPTRHSLRVDMKANVETYLYSLENLTDTDAFSSDIEICAMQGSGKRFLCLRSRVNLIAPFYVKST
jgi:hypothetical protein